MTVLPTHPATTGIDASQPCNPPLRLGGLHLKLRDITLLRNLDLDLHPDKALVVTGASGNGKTTLLKAIAGIAPVSAGRIHYDPRIGYVFQEPRLLPWYTAHRNVTLMAVDEVTGWFDADEWLDRVGWEMSRTCIRPSCRTAVWGTHDPHETGVGNHHLHLMGYDGTCTLDWGTMIRTTCRISTPARSIMLVLGLLAGITAWWWAAASQPAYVLPGPAETWSALASQSREDHLWTPLITTLLGTLTGMASP